MHGSRTPRYCRCGTRLTRYRAEDLCGQCEKKLATLRATPPEVPAEFWDTPQFRDAFAAQHIGQVCRAYRKHPYHRAIYGSDGIPQEVVGGWLGLTQAQISRIETGAPVQQLDSLARWARTLRIPAHLLWFRSPAQHIAPPAAQDSPAPALTGASRQGHPEIDDMNRRELLRLVSMAGASLAVPLDWERIQHTVAATGRLDSETLDEYAALNSHLWRVFVLSTSKARTLPLVRSQIAILVSKLGQSQSLESRQRLCALAADVFQLAGEIFFDSNAYTDAAHCYTLAASASKEAEAFDLWACALTRHAFVSLYERQFDAASPILELAAGLAQRGDGTLSTRHWVAAVQAEAFAGLGQLDLCQQALDKAEEVHQLTGQVHNGGWLRFDGSRLAEERGTCYVALHRPDLAEAALGTALAQHLSTRRRGSVLVDLALIGVQRRDRDSLITHADAGLDLARQTGSGVIARRLRGLQTQLEPMLTDREVYRLHQRIAAVVGAPAA
jgi:hypothetical protein